MHNDMLAKELTALMKGERAGQGFNGLQAIEEVEKLIEAIPMEELKITNPERAKRLEKKETSKNAAIYSKDAPMMFVQNMVRNE